MPPKRPIPAAPKSAKHTVGGELDAKCQMAFPETSGEGSYAAVAHSNTPDAREKRQFLREAQKKGVTREVLKAVGKSGSGGGGAAGGSGAAGNPRRHGCGARAREQQLRGRSWGRCNSS
jgi:hypothetical protein